MNIPSITTETPTILTPSPALTLNRKECKGQSPEKNLWENWNTAAEGICQMHVHLKQLV